MRIVLLTSILVLSFSSVKAQPLYFPPLAGNSWDTISPASLGWCQPQLDSLITYLGERQTKAFIILKDGKIVVENYYGSFTRDSVWYWASAGKSLTSVLVGIAEQEAHLSISDTTSKYLGQGWTSAPALKEEKITIRDQLSMTTGLDENASNADCTIDTCLQYLVDAGTRWSYHNAPYTLLDGVIENATGVTLNNYLISKLTLSTGISGVYVPVDFNNVFFSKPRSMARFGLLMLNDGNWNGNQILNNSYFQQMVNSSQMMNPSYGYLWWLNGKSSFMLPGIPLSFPGTLLPSAPADMYSAIGKNGQILNVVPSLNMVVVRLGDVPFQGPGSVPVFFNDTLWQKLNLAMCAPVSIQELTISPKIYPNPAAGQITIDLPGTTFDVSISDMRGRDLIFADGQVNSSTLQLSLTKGVYIVAVRTDGKQIFRRKIIIE